MPLQRCFCKQRLQKSVVSCSSFFFEVNLSFDIGQSFCDLRSFKFHLFWQMNEAPSKSQYDALFCDGFIHPSPIFERELIKSRDISFVFKRQKGGERKQLFFSCTIMKLYFIKLNDAVMKLRVILFRSWISKLLQQNSVLFFIPFYHWKIIQIDPTTYNCWWGLRKLLFGNSPLDIKMMHCKSWKIKLNRHFVRNFQITVIVLAVRFSLRAPAANVLNWYNFLF